MTKDDIAQGLRICGKKMGCGHCPGKRLKDPLGERLMTDYPLPECLACPDFVDKAQDDLEAFYGRADNG